VNMSADNGVYILETPARTGFPGPENKEYRVRELQAIDNIGWDPNKLNSRGTKGDETDDPDVMILNARRMWAGCKAYMDKGEALKIAAEVLDSCWICEYGIRFIQIDRVF